MLRGFGLGTSMQWDVPFVASRRVSQYYLAYVWGKPAFRDVWFMYSAMECFFTSILYRRFAYQTSL